MRRPKPDPVAEGQKSVWDFPRPAIAQAVTAHIQVILAGCVIVDTGHAIRTIETSHPPTYYIPLDDIAPGTLRLGEGESICEWKGRAVYYDVVAGDVVRRRAAWSYLAPTSSFAMIWSHVAFYAAAMDQCLVDGERVRPQPGGFYGGWITSRFAGPFKGVPGSDFW